MTRPRLSTLSTEWVRMPVWAREAGDDVDLADTTTVEVAFVVDPGTGDPVEPQPADWAAGEWEVDPEFNVTYARGLASGLTAGTYRMWIRIDGAGVSPEVPVLTHDVLVEVF
jgi:hypothetical protein